MNVNYFIAGFVVALGVMVVVDVCSESEPPQRKQGTAHA